MKHTLVCSSWALCVCSTIRTLTLISYDLCCRVLPESHAQACFQTALATTNAWVFLFQPFLQLKTASAALQLHGDQWEQLVRTPFPNSRTKVLLAR